MTIRAARLFRFRTFALLVLAALLLVRVGPFCEASAMAAGTGPTAMVGCVDIPAALTDKGAPTHCIMTACPALADTSAGLAAPVIYAASLLPLPIFAARDGLKPTPATPPPRST